VTAPEAMLTIFASFSDNRDSLQRSMYAFYHTLYHPLTHRFPRNIIIKCKVTDDLFMLQHSSMRFTRLPVILFPQRFIVEVLPTSRRLVFLRPHGRSAE